MHPVDKAAHEFAVVVRVAGREIERAVHPDRLDRAGSNAELAVEAGCIVERFGRHVDRAVDDDGAEQDEAAETRMDHVSVQAHLAEAGGHRKGGGGIDGADTHFFEPAHGPACDLVHIVIGLMKFLVCDRADGCAHRVAVHAADKRDQRSGAGQQCFDPCRLRADRRIVRRHEAAIVGAAFHHQIAQEVRR